MPSLLATTRRCLPIILAFLGNVVGLHLLGRNPDFKQLFGAKEQEWLVNAIWSAARHLVSFLLICNLLFGSQIIDSNIERQRNDRSPDDIDTTGDQSAATSKTSDLQASQIEPSGRSALNQLIEVSEIALKIYGDRTSEGLIGEDGSNEGHIRQGSWDFNEHHWDIGPPRICFDTSSSSGDSEEGGEKDVPRVSKCVVKEVFVERTSATDDRVGKIEESEFPCQKISHEEHGNYMRSVDHMEIGGGFESGAYEKDHITDEKLRP
ncbi:hypothetical protein L6164_000386 [Bauhinia variegata]|uniref:Uncharacterized protein n=1 Tax=Bauhinia variegata TaxID=167791 RepID=A0ACB9Q8K9_BAUVA|nr:hypothetical protein L6164_000386 [Bauhinia variegata]